MFNKKIWFVLGMFIKYNLLIGMDAVPLTIKEHIENALSIGNIDEAKKVTQFHAFENVQQYRLPFRMFTVLEYVRSLTSIGLPAKTASRILAYNGVNYIVDTSGVRLLQN